MFPLAFYAYLCSIPAYHLFSKLLKPATLHSLCCSAKWSAVVDRLMSLDSEEATAEILYSSKNDVSTFIVAVHQFAPLKVLQMMCEVCELSPAEHDIAARPAAKNQYPLHYAADNNSGVAIVKLLIRKYPNALLKECTDYLDRTEAKFTPLKIAENRPQCDELEKLLRDATKCATDRDWAGLAGVVEGDARSLARSFLTPEQLESEKVRVLVLLCVRRVLAGERGDVDKGEGEGRGGREYSPSVEFLADLVGFRFLRSVDEPKIEMRRASKALCIDCWSYVLGYL